MSSARDTAARRARATPAAAPPPAISDEQNRQLLYYAGLAVGAAIVYRMLVQTLMGAAVLVFPLVYLYCVLHCPSPESFDAKKELKRVLRGHHLPENHPDKPQGFLSETLARVNASLTTELATGLGYEVTMIPVAMAGHVACVRVPSVQQDFYWVGVANKWFYVISMNLDSKSS